MRIIKQPIGAQGYPLVNRDIAIRSLDPQLAQAVWPQLVKLDRTCYKELGIRYSHVMWDREEFLRDFPGKWQLSCVAFDDGGGVTGFWIASQRDNKAAHTHRVAVSAQSRRQRVGQQMFWYAEAASATLGATLMTLMVQVANEVAIRFYRGLGFRAPTPAECLAFAEDHQKRCRAQEGIIVEPGGVEYLLFVQDLGQRPVLAGG